MRQRIIEDESGQSALFDAVMFLVVMIIASSIITVYSSQYSKDVDLTEREDMMVYARDTSEVVLGATLYSTWYEDINSQIIEKPPGDTTVLSLILEELYLLNCGVPKENFVLGYEQDIKILLKNLVTSSHHFALQGYNLNESNKEEYRIFISDIVPDYDSKEEALQDKTDYSQLMPRGNLATIQMTLPMIGTSQDAQISFSLWI